MKQTETVSPPNWARDSKKAHDGHWTIGVEQDYTFWTVPAESLLAENNSSRGRGERAGYTGNFLNFLKESRPTSVRLGNTEEFFALFDRVEKLAGLVKSARSALPEPVRDDARRRADAKTVKLVIAGDNKLALHFLVNILTPFDLTCLSLHQHQAEARRLLPLKFDARTIRDWRTDYINYVRRRARGIFKDTRNLAKPFYR